MDTAVLDFLKGDRQWLRGQRIAHAQWQLARSADTASRTFWTAVLHALDVNDWTRRQALLAEKEKG